MSISIDGGKPWKLKAGIEWQPPTLVQSLWGTDTADFLNELARGHSLDVRLNAPGAIPLVLPISGTKDAEQALD